jgi:Tol biopolymer transport system component
LTARRNNERNFRIWQVFSASGEALPLTKDSESYSALSLDRNASGIVATQVKRETRLLLFQMDNPSINRVLADAVAFAFAPNGSIFFSSDMTGNDEIWCVNADGGARRQLTNNSGVETSPVVSSDNNLIFFASNRTGAVHVWRMNADGSNQTQITQNEGGFPIFVSPDGHWLYYHHGLQRTLWRVSTKGGEEQLVLNKEKYRFAVSPDGLQAAFSEREGEERILTIVSLADGQIFKTFRLSDRKARLPEIAWSPDGKSLAYITTDSKFENNILWLQSLDGGTPQQVAALGDERIEHLAVVPGGKSFAVAQGGWKHDAVLISGLK